MTAQFLWHRSSQAPHGISRSLCLPVLILQGESNALNGICADINRTYLSLSESRPVESLPYVIEFVIEIIEVTNKAITQTDKHTC